MTTNPNDPCRREFLRLFTAGALGLILPGGRLLSAQKAAAKPLRGIFPIAQSPFTESNELDLAALVEEVKFIDRGRVHGFVWPQMASEWSTLTERERFEGAEAITDVGRKLRPAIVIGVQGPDVATAVRYAKHAEKIGADAVISLPPSENIDPKAALEYYREVGKATELPLFVQAVGNMSVDLIVEISRAAPTMRYVKDEAGQPLNRILPLREKSSEQIKVFSGAHGRTLIEEMRRGISGSMPAVPFADLYAATWDLWHAGRRQEAMDMHARTLLILTEMNNYGLEATKYILYLRGVFKTWGIRGGGSQGFSSAARLAAGGQGERPRSSLDEAGKQSLREALEFVKPYLRA
ncbi:MAG: dihydrodipicolinate synthase family protein [Acidobacteria bacterium]|jgi:4-hydroxy-tetrahydrodipicolinate synthase|nr:dihydrodipicolinate synthase family protein [Acidobacteriota bacterium]